MPSASPIGAFLRSRRARLRPGDVGLGEGVRRRRVPGLRREEFAPLAGVSVGYYTRLEQGQTPNVSDAVLDAIARTLRLDEEERAHLYRLARPDRRASPDTGPDRLLPGLRAVVDSIVDLPVLAVGRAADYLAWNRLAHALFAWNQDFAAAGRRDPMANIVRQDFLDPMARELHVDWRQKAVDGVAYLQVAAGRYPRDRAIAALIAELREASGEFVEIWETHPIGTCATTTRRYRHPALGELTLTAEFLRSRDDAGQGVSIFSAAPGSESEAKLRRLAAELAQAS
ncbi:helix-turn-helix transcriptional regulator [Glycomyces tenuis]|uniref:helix-turn-helix transcriptional regulator n=1 Tax=Glycomyces tenuis TaxID=58116 RepID=UPI001B7FE2FE|nr:helix-turn-helix transcriptional regulator [Glycomyces tenuis]